MLELAQHPCLDLSDALARYLEGLTHLFQCVVGLLADAEAHARTLSSRGVSVASTFRVCSARFVEMSTSAGEGALLSSTKSLRCESSSSPMGVSSEIGSFAEFQDLSDLVQRKLHRLVESLRSL